MRQTSQSTGRQRNKNINSNRNLIIIRNKTVTKIIKMNSASEENFEYRHKKFDKSKRIRSDSLSSYSSADNASVQLETKNICKNPVGEKSLALNCSTVERVTKRRVIPDDKKEFCITPPAKRPRVQSFASATDAATIPGVAAAAAVLPKLSDETLSSICKYHGNMVRYFPKKERTPKDQERRNKNTIACRMSRRVKKLEHIAIEEQYKDFSKQTFNIIEQSIRATAYLHELMKLTACSQLQKEEQELEQKSPKSLVLNENSATTIQQKNPFTIAFLTGNV